jgi:hypothetical protein
MIGVLLSLWLLSSLTGCAGLNEGAVDYRYLEPAKDNGLILRGFKQKYFGKNQLPKNIIKSNQSVSIRLMQAYICDFREGGIAPDMFSHPGNKGDTPCDGRKSFASTSTGGEIAIIVNAFERDENTKIRYDKNAINKGRLVYYNSDVRETGQHLNFNNLPVYGPITYKGHPFFIDLIILEMDEVESQKLNLIMSELASLGSKAYPPSSPVLGILNLLGGALLSGDQNDVEFRYNLELEPLGGDGLVVRAPLATGYYAFVRMEKRNNPVPWANLGLDAKTGRLIVCEDSKQGKTNYRPWTCGTYLTFKIDTNESTLALDGAQLFEEFKEAQASIFQNEATQISKQFKEAAQKITGYLTNRKAERLLANLMNIDNDNDERKEAALSFVQTICLDLKDGKEMKPDIENIVESFNITGIGTFDPKTHCKDKANFVNGLTFK